MIELPKRSWRDPRVTIAHTAVCAIVDRWRDDASKISLRKPEATTL